MACVFNSFKLNSCPPGNQLWHCSNVGSDSDSRLPLEISFDFGLWCDSTETQFRLRTSARLFLSEEVHSDSTSLLHRERRRRIRRTIWTALNWERLRHRSWGRGERIERSHNVLGLRNEKRPRCSSRNGFAGGRLHRALVRLLSSRVAVSDNEWRTINFFPFCEQKTRTKFIRFWQNTYLQSRAVARPNFVNARELHEASLNSNVSFAFLATGRDNGFH